VDSGEQEKSGQRDCVEVGFQIQERDTDCVLISLYVLQRTDEA